MIVRVQYFSLPVWLLLPEAPCRQLAQRMLNSRVYFHKSFTETRIIKKGIHRNSSSIHVFGVRRGQLSKHNSSFEGNVILANYGETFMPSARSPKSRLGETKSKKSEEQDSPIIGVVNSTLSYSTKNRLRRIQRSTL